MWWCWFDRTVHPSATGLTKTQIYELEKFLEHFLNRDVADFIWNKVVSMAVTSSRKAPPPKAFSIRNTDDWMEEEDNTNYIYLYDPKYEDYDPVEDGMNEFATHCLEVVSGDVVEITQMY